MKVCVVSVFIDNVGVFAELYTRWKMSTFVHIVSTSSQQALHMKDNGGRVRAGRFSSEKGARRRTAIRGPFQTFTGEERKEDTRAKILSTVSFTSLSEFSNFSILSQAYRTVV